MNVWRDTSETKPTAWCHAGIQATYARLFPGLRWEAIPGEIDGIASLIVFELESRRASLALSQIPLESLPEFARKGWIQPLDDWFAPEQLAPYAPQALALAMVKGRLYAIPEDITPFVFFVRADLLKRLGLAPPRTWDEFEALAEALARKKRPLSMIAGGPRFRQGFMLALLGSNGIATADSDRLAGDAHRMVEAYDWLRRMIFDRRLLPLEEIVRTRSLTTTTVRPRMNAGFGWLSAFHGLPPAVLRRFIFLPFPRGPSLAPGAMPGLPMKGSGWCMPWNRCPVEEVVAALHAIHTPATLRAVGNADAFPFIAVRARWDARSVQRKYPLCRHAGGLIDGTQAVPSAGLDHYGRLELTFRNALMDGLSGPEWVDAYICRQDLRAARGDPPVWTVLRAIDARLDQSCDIGDIARSLGLHPRRLRHLLRRELNEGGGDFLQRRRLETARALLIAGGLSIKQVAGRVGYRNAAAFTRAYRAHYGHTPSAEGKGAGTP